MELLNDETAERKGCSADGDTANETENNLCRDVVVYSEEQAVLSWKADRAWCVRLLTLASNSVQMQTLMAWYSTLGGAYSALGQNSLHHAEQAGNVSQQQLLLATELQDPLLVSKCKLYMAFSLLQRGKTKRAARIVRDQYKFALRESAVCDTKLISMCVSAWQQIKLLQTAHHSENLSQGNIQQIKD